MTVEEIDNKHLHLIREEKGPKWGLIANRNKAKDHTKITLMAIVDELQKLCSDMGISSDVEKIEGRVKELQELIDKQ